MIKGQAERCLDEAYANIDALLKENEIMKAKLDLLNNLNLGIVSDASMAYANDFTKVMVGNVQAFSFVRGVKWLVSYLNEAK